MADLLPPRLCCILRVTQPYFICLMRKKFYRQKKDFLTIIAPNKEIIRLVVAAVELIKRVDKMEYKKLPERLKIIFVTNRFGFTNEFFMPEKIWFANKSVILKNDVNWLASLIIHEAYHATQFKKGKYILPLSRLESAAMKIQKNFLRKLGESGNDANIAWAGGYDKKMIEDKISFGYFRNLLDLFKEDKLNFILIK